ncbi:DUF3644 domain-containing protein [Allokutzneria albata]|uniref:DUF3644 domain-containing protein n=1 Tax=Allokutzneria albata TaxID=211114 RepID=A0A1G9YAN1_ALLAB|nr:DUF3644 domain-containing protein [Allokutzneria albata]SDN05575.1 hypothetical protein SAMN04489726_4674 [Allokutzneria albata]
MKLKQESRVLKRKALASLTSAVEAFNSPHGDGRETKVLLHLQHAFEMLLKAALVQGRTKVFDRVTGRSIGFEKCVGLACASATIKLNDADAGTLRAIDAMRDEEQHWFNTVPEQLLYLHARAGVTLFDDLLQRAFRDRLATHLPTRVLPVSVDPPRDLTVLLDEEYNQIADLLRPGRRARHEARARIRTLLAMEAHVEPDVRVSSKDVDRVERGIRNGASRDEVFPRLEDVTAVIDGAGITVTVHFTKKQGAPVRYVADESVPAAAIREVDLQRKFHRSPTALAQALNLTLPLSKALRDHLGIDADETCSHEFVFGSQRHWGYSDNAFTKMREAISTLDMDAIWRAHKHPGRAKSKPQCMIPDCQAA